MTAFSPGGGILAALAGSLERSAAALDLGRADGALTINGKSTPLQYAYAFFDSGENGQRIVDVLLTDNAVPNPGPKPEPRKLRSQGLTVVEVRMTPSGQPVRMVFVLVDGAVSDDVRDAAGPLEFFDAVLD